MVTRGKIEKSILVAIGFTVILSCLIVQGLGVVSASATTGESVRRAFDDSAYMLRTSCVIQGMNDERLGFKQALDGAYDIAYYYLDTYTTDTMEGARYTTFATACSYWAHNPRHTEFASHGACSAGSPYYTPYLCFQSGGDLSPDYLAWYVSAGSMSGTDAVFLGSCYSLMNFEADRPASVSFGKTFIKHAGAHYVIGDPYPMHAVDLLLFTAYFWHFKLVYGFNTITAFNCAKQSVLIFLGYAMFTWPTSYLVCLLWLNYGLAIPLPTIISNLLIWILCLFPVGALIAAFYALQLIVVDTAYYG
jgi:hypothetical protein